MRINTPHQDVNIVLRENSSHDILKSRFLRAGVVPVFASEHNLAQRIQDLHYLRLLSPSESSLCLILEQDIHQEDIPWVNSMVRDRIFNGITIPNSIGIVFFTEAIYSAKKLGERVLVKTESCQDSFDL